MLTPPFLVDYWIEFVIIFLCSCVCVRLTFRWLLATRIFGLLAKKKGGNCFGIFNVIKLIAQFLDFLSYLFLTTFMTVL